MEKYFVQRLDSLQLWWSVRAINDVNLETCYISGISGTVPHHRLAAEDSKNGSVSTLNMEWDSQGNYFSPKLCKGYLYVTNRHSMLSPKSVIHRC